MTLLDTLFGRFDQAAPRKGFLARVNAAMALRRSRARLAELDDHMLADIGLTSRDAEAEANRPIWDAPQTWKH
ncbi:DUF1127 domain-containing protein [Marivita hallyeonensis]|nr:DUF1127 domain-containing protein [Marivita hallyeonensis]